MKNRSRIQKICLLPLLVICISSAFARGMICHGCGTNWAEPIIAVLLVFALVSLLALIGTIFNKDAKEFYSSKNIIGGFIVIIGVLLVGMTVLGQWQGLLVFVLLIGLPLLASGYGLSRRDGGAIASHQKPFQKAQAKLISQTRLASPLTMMHRRQRKKNEGDLIENNKSDSKNQSESQEEKSFYQAVQTNKKSIDEKLREFREKRRLIEAKEAELALNKKFLSNLSPRINSRGKTIYLLNNREHYFDGQNFIQIKEDKLDG